MVLLLCNAKNKVNDTTNAWLKVTNDGTYGVSLAGCTVDTTLGSQIVSFNALSAKLLSPGQWINIPGAFTKQYIQAITLLRDTNHSVIGATAVMASPAATTEVGAAVTYVAPTILFIP